MRNKMKKDEEMRRDSEINSGKLSHKKEIKVKCGRQGGDEVEAGDVDGDGDGDVMMS